MLQAGVDAVGYASAAGLDVSIFEPCGLSSGGEKTVPIGLAANDTGKEHCVTNQTLKRSNECATAPNGAPVDDSDNDLDYFM